MPITWLNGAMNSGWCLNWNCSARKHHWMSPAGTLLSTLRASAWFESRDMLAEAADHAAAAGNNDRATHLRRHSITRDRKPAGPPLSGHVDIKPVPARSAAGQAPRSPLVIDT